MTSIGSDYRLVRTGVGLTDDAMRLTMGINGELGIGSPESGLTGTANAGVPLSLTLGKPDATQIIPFITPSLEFVATGGKSAGNSSPVRAGRGLLGGGVALFNPKSALGASVGFQYVFVTHTELQVGVGLSLGGR
jgi:hypothetical protein